MATNGPAGTISQAQIKKFSDIIALKGEVRENAIKHLLPDEKILFKEYVKQQKALYQQFDNLCVLKQQLEPVWMN